MTFPGLGEPFPEREEDILDLALRMIDALEQNPDRYPNPPVPAAEMRAQVEECRKRIAEAAAADQALRQSFADKERAILAVMNALKARLLYTERDVRGEPEKLSGLGWGGSETSDREPPGAVWDIAIRSRGDTWVILDWQPPADGGPAAAYQVQRRKPAGSWEHAATAVDNDCLLSDQPRGIEFELRVVAVNKAGAGQPSATVTVVL